MHTGVNSSSTDSSLATILVDSPSTLLVQYPQSVQINPSQTSILKAYFDSYLIGYITLFRNSAPLELTSLRTHLVICSTDFEPELFTTLLNKFYPTPAEDSSEYKQNQKLRNFFIRFNKLCQETTNINHSLYNFVFNDKISSFKPSSPVKQSIVSKYFKKQIENHFKASINNQDPWVLATQNFVQSLAVTSKSTASSVEYTSVSRKLF